MLHDLLCNNPVLKQIISHIDYNTHVPVSAHLHPPPFYSGHTHTPVTCLSGVWQQYFSTTPVSLCAASSSPGLPPHAAVRDLLTCSLVTLCVCIWVCVPFAVRSNGLPPADMLLPARQAQTKGFIVCSQLRSGRWATQWGRLIKWELSCIYGIIKTLYMGSKTWEAGFGTQRK